MNILLLSTGGGGGNILRSLKSLHRQDLRVAQKTDAKYTDRFRKAIATRFLDTNVFSLSDIPEDERVIIGTTTTRRLGSMHDPELAAKALDESKAEVEALIARYSVVVVIGTGGKGTGAGTIVPLAQIARQQRKLVIPVFVRPSFEWHEVEKRRYDHALHIAEQFDAAGIRIVELLNDRAYSSAAPESQSVVWERMNRPIARGLRGLLYVLWDLSQVDPSDLSALFAGHGRLRIDFSEINPPAGQDPGQEQIDEAVNDCWTNRYCAFSGPVGTSLVCLQGEWSNVADGMIKGRLAKHALEGAREPTYNPLYTRIYHAPKPWGVTTVFAEYTGPHPPLDIAWPQTHTAYRAAVEPTAAGERAGVPSTIQAPALAKSERSAAQGPPTFSNLRDFAVALNHLDPAAVALAANGAACDLSIDAADVRKLLATVWFRSAFARLSADWRIRILEVLSRGLTIPNHTVRCGRKTIHLSECTFEQLKSIVIETILPEAIRADLQLLVVAGTLWGGDVIKRFQFASAPEPPESSKLSALLQPFRHQ